MLNQDSIRAHLATIQDIQTGETLIQAGMIGGIAIDGSTVQIVLEVDPARGSALESLRQHVEQSVRTLAGVTAATVIMSSKRPSPASGRKPAPGKMSFPNIRHIIAVASGKGGVGKSTISTNLAVGLAANGLRVGLLDADIYGPSIPMMMGITERPQTDKDGNVLPIIRHNVACMSIGTMSKPDQALIWRGPMVQGALLQLMRDVAWGALDVLILDLPPGTGDIQLTMCQQIPLSGAIIVSTPQDIALIDARKAIAMFERVHVPILGMIENMSSFCCPNCGTETAIFGQNGAKEQAESLQIPFLGAVPLTIDVRIAGDAGTPIVTQSCKSSRALSDIAVSLCRFMAPQHQSRHSPPPADAQPHN